MIEIFTNKTNRDCQHNSTIRRENVIDSLGFVICNKLCDLIYFDLFYSNKVLQGHNKEPDDHNQLNKDFHDSTTKETN